MPARSPAIAQLAWTAAWHLREETYRRALAILVNAQQRQPLAALFGAADVSSSDGQHFPTAGRGEAVGAINAHYGRNRIRAVLHAPFGAPRAVPHGRDPAFRRSRLCHRRAALSRGRPEHRHPSYRWRRRQRSRLRPGVSARILVLPRASRTWPSAGSTPSGRRALAGVRAVHRRRASTRS